MLWDGDKVMNFISINITYMWGIYIYKGIGKEIFPSNSHKRLIIQVIYLIIYKRKMQVILLLLSLFYHILLSLFYHLLSFRVYLIVILKSVFKFFNI